MAQDDFFKLTPAPGSPSTLKPLNPAAQGRWRAAALSGQPAGIIWTDDEGGVGFFPYDSGKNATSASAQPVFMTFIRGCLSSGMDASAVYASFDQLSSASFNDEQTGLLSKVPIAAQSGASAVTAAAESDSSSMSGEVNAIVGDDDEVQDIALINTEGTGTWVRENKAWTEIQDDDDRIDGLEWLEVTPQVVDEWDKNPYMTRNDVVAYTTVS